MPGKWKYFADDEVRNLSEELVAKVDQSAHLTAVRCKELGIERVAYVITSGYRSPGSNAAAGGAKLSAHMKGLAVDVRARDPRAVGLIIKNFYAVGFTRIGLYFRKDANGLHTTHVHADCDESKDPDVFWLDDEGSA
jgi:hypothetical protein